MTPAARRRLAVLRGLVGAVGVGLVAWLALGGWGAVLLAGALVALVAYCALLASVHQPAHGPAGRRASGARGREGAGAGSSPARPRQADARMDAEPASHGA